MRIIVLLAVVTAGLGEYPATAPKPPTYDNYLNGSFVMEYSETPITSASVFEEERRMDDSWYMELMRNVQRYLMDCRKKTGAFDGFQKNQESSLLRMRDCLTESFLTSLDSALDENEIDVNPYVTVVKEKTGRVKMNPREDARNGDLIGAIYKRFQSIIDTHSFKLRFHDIMESANSFEGRRRHRHYRKAFPMMVAGYMMMSAFLIPLGFQFMAMLGGKALLLAKMAFFMSMFSGYKRLTNDLDFHHHGGFGGHEFFHHGGLLNHRSAESPMTQAFAGHPPAHLLALRKGK